MEDDFISGHYNMRILLPFLCIWIPKWQSVKGSEYSLREAAAYLAFHSKNDQYVELASKLVGHKYAATLTASRGQKGSIHQANVLDGLDALFPNDRSTRRMTEVSRRELNRLLQSRLKTQRTHMAEIARNKLQTNLKMGPGASTNSYISRDGMLCGEQKAEVDSCPRPVPPFPFMRDDSLASTEQIQLLEEVWAFTNDTRELAKVKGYKQRQRSNAETVMDGGNDDGSGDEQDGASSDEG